MGSPVFLLAAAPLWHDMLVPGIPVIEKLIRPVVVYVFLVIGLRVFGKRELAQLNPFDLVVLLSLSNTVQNAIIGDDVSVTGGLLGAFALLSVNYLVVRFLFRHHRLDQIVQGRSTVLVKDGRVLRKALARELITTSELMTILHRQGFARLSEVDHCEIEPGGTFSVTAREPRQAEVHHRELLDRLDGLQARLDDLQARLAKG